jgi:hypothetical protein
MAANLGEVMKPHACVSSKLAVARTANVATQAVAKGSRANVTAIKMHAAEVTATTEVATATMAAATAATAAACKGVGCETQHAQGDTRHQYSCHVGHHDSLRRTARACALGRTSQSMPILGGDLRRIAVLDTSLRVNADENLLSLMRATPARYRRDFENRSLRIRPPLTNGVRRFTGSHSGSARRRGNEMMVWLSAGVMPGVRPENCCGRHCQFSSS